MEEARVAQVEPMAQLRTGMGSWDTALVDEREAAMTDLYSAALRLAREKVDSFLTLPLAHKPELTEHQLTAIRVMVSDAYICGHDKASTQPSIACPCYQGCKLKNGAALDVGEHCSEQGPTLGEGSDERS